MAAYERANKLKNAPPSKEIMPDCPICKTNDVTHYKKRESNGVIGPGSRAWTVEEYFICNDCGVNFCTYFGNT